MTLATSRFLKPAEANCWPREGDALAVAWGLENSRFFTLGCKELHITTDHFPLIGLLDRKDLSEIDNRRLVLFRERTFLWNFEVHNVECKNNHGSDFVSRNLIPIAEDERGEEDTLAAVVQVELAVLAVARFYLEEAKAVS